MNTLAAPGRFIAMSFASPFRAAVWPVMVTVPTICFLTTRAREGASPNTISSPLIAVNSAAGVA